MVLSKSHAKDCGCGVGGPAREIARFSGAHITGINNNAYQITRANKHTKDQNLTHLVSFVKVTAPIVQFAILFCHKTRTHPSHAGQLHAAAHGSQ
jgi:ubiquinone/menaquinone biosynthesis C-methylase UbiE